MPALPSASPRSAAEPFVTLCASVTVGVVTNTVAGLLLSTVTATPPGAVFDVSVNGRFVVWPRPTLNVALEESRLSDTGTLSVPVTYPVAVALTRLVPALEPPVTLNDAIESPPTITAEFWSSVRTAGVPLVSDTVTFWPIATGALVRTMMVPLRSTPTTLDPSTLTSSVGVMGSAVAVKESGVTPAGVVTLAVAVLGPGPIGSVHVELT